MRERQADLLVQDVDPFGDFGLLQRLGPQMAVAIQRRGEAGDLATALASHVPQHPRRHVRGGRDADFVVARGFRMRGDGGGDEFGRPFQRHGGRELARWTGPALDRFFEHGQRAGIERDEQAQPTEDAHPDMDVLVDLDDVVADAHAKNRWKESAQQPAAGMQQAERQRVGQ